MTEQGSGGKAAVLLADDSKLVRFTAKKILGEEFDLLLAEDGGEAWEVLMANPGIQLVLSDLQMPVLDGFGLLQKIRNSDDARVSALPVIMVTGAENKDGPKQQAMDLGATDFITKPFDHAHLQARVRAHVGHQRQTRSLMEQVNVDTVTGLPNREAFENRLAKDAAFVTRHKHNLAVMLIQLDGYKDLFEIIGREGYDRIMKQIASLLQKSVRQEDTVARAGLAQFLVSLPTAESAGANELARRIATTVESYDMKVNGKPWPLSLSIGVHTSAAGSKVEPTAVLQGVKDALEQSMGQGNSHISVLGAAASQTTTLFSLDRLLQSLNTTGQLPADISVEQLTAILKPLLSALPEQARRNLLNPG